MTPAQKRAHIENLKDVVCESGFTQDAYGNFKNATKRCRVKFKKNNIRFERLNPALKEWTKVRSCVMVQLSCKGCKQMVDFMNHTDRSRRLKNELCNID